MIPIPYRTTEHLETMYKNQPYYDKKTNNFVVRELNKRRRNKMLNKTNFPKL